MPLTLTQTVPPTSEPLQLDDVKTYLRLHEGAAEDYILLGMIAAARAYVETVTRQQLVSATYTLTLDCFPAVIRPPRPPLLSVSSIAYLDTAGDLQTLSAALYQVDSLSRPGRIMPARSQAWPSTDGDSFNAVTVTYVAGYGNYAQVPEVFKAIILLLVADLYEHREAQSEVRLDDNKTVARLLQSARLVEA